MSYPFDLTDLELSLIRSLCEGRTLEGAAIDIGINRHTAGDYLKAIHNKMAVHSRMSLALKAERAGLLKGVDV